MRKRAFITEAYFCIRCSMANTVPVAIVNKNIAAEINLITLPNTYKGAARTLFNGVRNAVKRGSRKEFASSYRIDFASRILVAATPAATDAVVPRVILAE